MNPIVMQRPPRSVYPKWEAWRPFFNPTLYKFLGNTSNELRQVNNVLDKAVTVLDQVKSFVSLLAELEALIKQGILGFIQLIADKLDRIVTDFESTGIYFLDLTSYHFTDKTELERTQEHNNDEPKPWWDPDRNVSAELTSQSPKQKTSEEQSRIKQLGIILSNFFALMNANYERESYNQFITRICNAFTDPNDVPRGGLYDEFMRIKKLEDFSLKSGDIKVVDPSMLKGTRKQIPYIFQTGKPDFGPNCTMYVFIFGFTVPNINDLYMLISKVGKVFKIFTENSIVKKIIDFYNDPKKQQEIEKFLKGLINEFDVDFLPYQEQKKSELASREEPNFLGITAYSLFGQIFDEIHRLINKLRSFTYNIDTSLLDVIMQILDAIENDIRNLKRIIQSIIDVIDFINSLLALTQFFYLKVVTHQGTADVIDQIYNSKGFFMISQDSLDKMDNDEIDRGNSVNDILNTYSTDREKANEEHTHYLSIYNELLSLKTIVQQWLDYAELSNPPSKRSLSKINQDITNENTKYLQDKAIIDNNITIQKNDPNSVVSFKTKRDLKISERDTFSTGMSTQISAKQSELDLLIQQYNDSQNPALSIAVPDNYENRKSALELEILILTDSKNSSLVDYNNLINRLSSTISFIEATSQPQYETARTTAINNLNVYKVALTNLTNQYNIDKLNKENDITSKENDLTINRQAQTTKRLLINSIQNQIDLWIIEHGLPVDPVLQEQFDLANIQLNTLLTEENSLIAQIDILKNDLITIDINYQSSKTQNTKNQEIEQWKLDCFSIEIIIRNLVVSLTVLTNTYNNKISYLTIEKSSIYSGGINILALQNQYVLGLNVLTKIEPYYIDEQESDINQKKKYSTGDYNINDPDITRIENIITIYDTKGYLNSVKAKVDIIDGQIKHIIKENKKKLQEYTERRTMLQGLMNNFDPDKPGYYGGFLVCMGYPNIDNGNYFNFGELTHQYWNGPNGVAIGDKAQEWDEKKKSILKLF